MEFRLLGPLAVTDQGSDIYIPAGRQRTILAHLLLRRERTVSADELIDDFWDGRPPRGARSALYSYMTRLRESLGENSGIIKTMPNGYVITVGENDVDLQKFVARHAQGQRARLSRDWQAAADHFGSALDLWRGEPFVDVDSEELRRIEAPALEELRLSSLSGRIEAELSLGRHTAVVPELQRLFDAWPSREEFAEQLMLALYRSRRRSDALAVYRKARRYLVEELGVEPGAELQTMHERILLGEEALTGPRDDKATPAALVPAPPAIPAELPSTVADFSGRHREIRELSRMLIKAATMSADGLGCVVTVTGPCGVGKTALAVHVAHQVKGRFPDGQIFLDLHGSTAGQERLETVLARLGRALGIEDRQLTGDIDERSALIRSAMTGRRILLLLDDASDDSYVRPLLPASCAVIVTSRWRLASLAVCHRIALDYLDQEESRSLLAGIVGDERVEAERPAVDQLLRVCAGSPLALRIAGQRIATRPGWSVQHLASSWAEWRHRLGRLQLGDLAVRSRLDASYAELSRLSARAGGPARGFRLLSLWQGIDLSLPAAAALLGQPLDATESDLELLVDLHLLESRSEARYRFHDLIFCYARERAEHDESAQARNAAVRRLLLWYSLTVEAAASALGPVRLSGGGGKDLLLREPGIAPLTFASPAAARAWLAAERRNMTVAIGGPTYGRQVAAVLGTVLDGGGRSAESEPAARRVCDQGQVTASPAGQH